MLRAITHCRFTLGLAGYGVIAKWNRCTRSLRGRSVLSIDLHGHATSSPECGLARPNGLKARFPLAPLEVTRGVDNVRAAYPAKVASGRLCQPHQ